MRYQGMMALLVAALTPLLMAMQPIDGHLLVAVMSNNPILVGKLLEQGADPNHVQNGGTTPLQYAVALGGLDVAILLIEKGANVNQAMKDGTTPLIIAAQSGHRDIVALLIEKGAAINQATLNGKTALTAATTGRHEAVRKLLIEKGATSARNIAGSDTRNVPTLRGKQDIAQILKENWIEWDGDKEKALMKVVTARRRDLAALLIENGALVNVATPPHKTLLRGDEGESFNSPLFIAVREVDPEMVALLLEKGADPNHLVHTQNRKTVSTQAFMNVLRAKTGRTGFAEDLNSRFPGSDITAGNVVKRCTDILNLLIEKGGNLSQADKDGATPLLEATFALSRIGKTPNSKATSASFQKRGSEHLEAVRDMIAFLIQKGVDVNLGNKYGTTAIINASSGGDRDMVALLLKNGADVNAISQYGETPLSEAVKFHDREMAAFLLENGAQVDLGRQSGSTPFDSPLTGAVHMNDLDMVALLLEKGADVNRGMKDNQTTPLHIAAINGNKDLVELLLQKGADKNALRIAPISRGSTITRTINRPVDYARQKGFTDLIPLLTP